MEHLSSPESCLQWFSNRENAVVRVVVFPGQDLFFTLPSAGAMVLTDIR